MVNLHDHMGSAPYFLLFCGSDANNLIKIPTKKLSIFQTARNTINVNLWIGLLDFEREPHKGFTIELRLGKKKESAIFFRLLFNTSP